MKFSKYLIGVVGLLILGGTVFAVRRPKEVKVTLPTRKQVTETIAASGRLRGVVESNIGAQNQGRVAAIYVREGDRIAANQIVARLDNSVLTAQVTQAQAALKRAEGQLAQAEANVKTAKAQFVQASRPPLTSDIARLRADIAQANAVNAARLTQVRQRADSAYQHLLELKNGTRSEEIKQAEAQVNQADANQAQYARDLLRQQTLFKDGVIARSELEQAETTHLVGKQTLENARARLQQLQAGSRSEQIAQAEADYRAARAEVVSAEATLTGGHASGKAQIDSLLASPRPEDVAVAQQQVIAAERSRDVARDQVTEAQVGLTLSERRLSETVVRAPFAGTVTQIVTESGSVTDPKTPLIRLVRTQVPEIRLDLDESNLGKLRIGQEATVTNDAFPESRFTATVHTIGAQVDNDRGTVEVRLTPKDPPSWIRPGQTFTVNIVTGAAQSRLIVPPAAVSTVSGVSSLLAVEKGKVVKKSIKVAPFSESGVPVLAGIDAQTQVILEPSGLIAGEAVSPKVMGQK